MELDKKYIYLWNSDVDKISNLIEEYIQRPNEELLADFPNDEWGNVDILLACDRRVGKKRLQVLAERTRNAKVKSIIEKRGKDK